jgi:2,3-dihydroxy-p-cumate/2,3-dihydroxybenzoate 3,4-dioxygenase
MSPAECMLVAILQRLENVMKITHGLKIADRCSENLRRLLYGNPESNRLRTKCCWEKPQLIRYRKLGYVALNVTDLEKSRKFYEEIVGLEAVGQTTTTLAHFRCDADPYSIVLQQRQPAGLKCVGWMLEDETQFATLHRRLRDAGAPFEELPAAECRARSIGRATRLMEPNTQSTIEFYVPESHSSHPSFNPSHTKIQRLGHVVFNTTHYHSGVSFFRDILNFLMSDTIGDKATLMRPFPSPYHHGIGLVADTVRTLNHVNFMVTEINDIGKAIHRLHRANVPIVYGPGRHPASGSVFLYFLDPDGLTLEYSFGMEKFAEINPRQPRAFALKAESLDSWGSDRDPRCGAKGELQNLQTPLSPQQPQL